jgi:hypothetical protein
LGAITSGTADTAVGNFSLGSLTSGTNNTAVGNYCGNGIITGQNNTLMGDNTGSVFDSSYCTYLGAGINGAAAGYSFCSVIGANAAATGNNRVILGRTADTVYVPGPLNITGASTFTGTVGMASATFSGTLNSVSTTVFGYISGLTSSAQTQINNILNGTSAFTGTVGFTNTTTSGTAQVSSQYVHNSGALITGTITLSSPYSEAYPIAPAGAFTITIPTASSALQGVSICFRRVNTNTSAITVSPAYYPLTSNSATTTALLTASATTQAGNSITLMCMQASATPTYAWYQIA